MQLQGRRISSLIIIFLNVLKFIFQLAYISSLILINCEWLATDWLAVNSRQEYSMKRRHEGKSTLARTWNQG